MKIPVLIVLCLLCVYVVARIYAEAYREVRSDFAAEVVRQMDGGKR